MTKDKSGETRAEDQKEDEGPPSESQARVAALNP